ncbi:hypothetical protein GQR58_029947 [Nymphon striatum]|nr:hypothetical protein GQR58_029947 [Nymphon striatum]
MGRNKHRFAHFIQFNQQCQKALRHFPIDVSSRLRPPNRRRPPLQNPNLRLKSRRNPKQKANLSSHQNLSLNPSRSPRSRVEWIRKDLLMGLVMQLTSHLIPRLNRHPKPNHLHATRLLRHPSHLQRSPRIARRFLRLHRTGPEVHCVIGSIRHATLAGAPRGFVGFHRLRRLAHSLASTRRFPHPRHRCALPLQDVLARVQAVHVHPQANLPRVVLRVPRVLRQLRFELHRSDRPIPTCATRGALALDHKISRRCSMIARAVGWKNRLPGRNIASGSLAPVCPSASSTCSVIVTGKFAQACWLKSSISSSSKSARSPENGIGRSSTTGSRVSGQRLHFRLGFNVELANAALECDAHFFAGFADAGKHDLAVSRIKRLFFVFLHVLGIGQRKALHDCHQGHIRPENTPDLGAQELRRVWLRFCGMMEEPVDQRSDIATKRNCAEDQMTSSSARRDRCIAQMDAAPRNSKAKSRAGDGIKRVGHRAIKA